MRHSKVRWPALLAFSATLITFFASGVAEARPNDLDFGFGSDGKVQTEVSGGSIDDLALQPDGKVVAVGGYGPTLGGLMRTNPDGSLDNTFSDDGKINAVGAEDIALQPDGKIVVAVTDSYSRPVSLVRYNADGSLDETFGNGGKAALDSQSWATAQDVAVQPDGKIVVAGRSQNETWFGLWRYKADGSPDTSFDGDGKVATPIRGNDEAFAVAVAPDGKILAAGKARGIGVVGGPTPAGPDFALARYNADGSLDTSFDGDGKVTTKVSSGTSDAYAVAVQPDGKVVAAGRTWDGSKYTSAVSRYNVNGSLDTSFSSDGKTLNDLGNAEALALQPDGKIVVGGHNFSGCCSHSGGSLARLDASGNLDTAFGRVASSLYGVRGLAVRQNGKIVAGGSSPGGGFTLEQYYGGEDVTRPGDITDLSASHHDSEVSLSWTNPTDTDFEATRVLRSTVGHAASATHIANQKRVYDGAARQYADTTIINDGNTYYYTVFARDASGNWSAAATVSVKSPDLTPPGPVTELRASPNENQISLLWKNPTVDFEATRVLRSESGFAVEPDAQTGQTRLYDGPGSSYDDTGLTNGTTYYYTVFARDASGNWSTAATVSEVPHDTTPPETVIDLNPGNLTNDNTPTLGFSGSDNRTHPSALLFSYRLDYGEWTPWSPETSVTLGGSTGMDDGHHTFEVRAKDSMDNVDESPAEQGFEVDTVAPSAADSVVAIPADRQISLSWSNPRDAGFEATRVLRSTKGFATDASGSIGQTFVYEGVGSEYKNTDLANGTTYYFTLFAKDHAGNWSARVTATGKPLPARPTTLTASSYDSVVEYDGETTITGRLSTSLGPVTEEKTVTLQRSTDGGTTWTPDGAASYDASEGTYRVARPLQRNTAFRLRFSGDPYHSAANSPIVLVKARANLAQPDTPDTVPRNATFTVSGFLKPRHQGYTRLSFYRYKDGDWRFYDRASAKNANFDEATTRYALRYKLPYKGWWQVKAYHKDSSHAPTWSPPREFLVE